MPITSRIKYKVIPVIKSIFILLALFSATQVLAEDMQSLRQRAEQGDASAQYKLCAAYVLGNEVVRDYTYAYMWCNLAAAQGNKEAIFIRNEWEKILDRRQIAEGQRLSREWKPK